MAASHTQVAAVCRHMQPGRRHDSARPAASEPATAAALSSCITAARSTVYAPKVSFVMEQSGYVPRAKPLICKSSCAQL